MTLGPGGDIFGVPSPSELVADCQAAGFQVIGGYAYDDDVLMTNPWTAAHISALTGAGIAFFPIITLRNESPATVGTLTAALQALGWTSGPVGWDREDPSAIPNQATVTGAVSGLREAGYGPHIGYRYPWGNLEGWYSALMDSVWAAVPGGSSTPPKNSQHVQYGSWKGHATYDLDTFTLEDLMGLTPEQAQQLQECRDFLAGSGNQILALAQALYAWDSGTGNGLNAKLDKVLALLEPPPPPNPPT